MNFKEDKLKRVWLFSFDEVEVMMMLAKIAVLGVFCCFLLFVFLMQSTVTIVKVTSSKIPLIRQQLQKGRKETAPSNRNILSRVGTDFYQLLTGPRVTHSQSSWENGNNDWQFSKESRNNIVNENIQDNSSARLQNLLTENQSVLNTLLGYEKYKPFFTAAVTGLCPSRSIRLPILQDSTDRTESHCVPHIPKQQDCVEAQKMYKINQPPLSCADNPEKQLCFIADKWRASHNALVTVECDLSHCGANPVFVASMDPSLGILETAEKWTQYSSKEKLEVGLQDIVSRNSLNGFNFCFLRCKHFRKTEDILNLLTFPPILQERSPKADLKLFNFNILVLDSVSRAHFYRSLPQSVSTLQDVVHNPRIKATALDFELLQSIAPHTFQNMKGFFSGSNYYDHDIQGNTVQQLGIAVLFNGLRKRGYRILLQEDNCWYDQWGTLLQNNVMHVKKPVETKQFRDMWEKFRKDVARYGIDDEGLSVSSCEVFKLFNASNQFNRPRRLCFNGRPLAEHFIRYQQNILMANKDFACTKPLFVYTHLSTGHEASGQRIRQIDEQLSQFLLSSAKDQNTLTFVFSDHGEKTTSYSFASLQGRRNVYDSLFFAIIPEGVAQKLGKDRLLAMIINQHRLITTNELHNTIMSIGNNSRENSKDFHKEGIFAEVPAKRDCSSVTIHPLALCKCRGWEEWLSNDDPTLPWIAEFALGQINNKIQHSVLRTNEKLGNCSSCTGFRKCQRLSGFYFHKARRRTDGKNIVVSLDVVVVPLYQSFEFQVRYPIKTPWPNPRRSGEPKMKPVARLSSFRRVSVYSDFSVCCDEGVQLQLCVCRTDNKFQRKRTSSKKPIWSSFSTQDNFLKYLANSVYFKSKTNIKVLHGRNCLLLLTRLHQSTTKVLEIANSCPDRKYSVTISGKSSRISLISSPLPIRLMVFPKEIHFLFTIYHLQKPHNFSPDIQFKMFNL